VLAWLVRLSCFRHRCGTSALHGAHVDVEQAVVLVALVLVLLSQLDDLLQDLHVEALALGLSEDLFLLLVDLLKLGLKVLNALNNERMRSPAIPTLSDMVSPS
jgi:hypothetical protein